VEAKLGRSCFSPLILDGVCVFNSASQRYSERPQPEGRLTIFEELGAQGKSSKFQAPSSKEAPSFKLKNRPVRLLPGRLFLGFGV
jgi:hypothetical protein